MESFDNSTSDFGDKYDNLNDDFNLMTAAQMEGSVVIDVGDDIIDDNYGTNQKGNGTHISNFQKLLNVLNQAVPSMFCYFVMMA